jgi:hypothetical protein
MVTNEHFWSVLKRIDGTSRKKMNFGRTRAASGSERQHLIRNEIPYNPLQIMREASRLAVEAGVRDGEMWSLDSDGACVCAIGSDRYAVTFFSSRRNDVDPGDADKLAALDVLAQVCEYIERRNNK